MPKVSVIIPTYNRQYIIVKTIESVLNQSKQDLEVIVVDDGSSDDTRGVVESLNDSRVRYFYKTNGGAASARNFGLSKAMGEYVAFLDSDDSWPENYLEVMLSYLQRNGAFGAAYSPITILYPDGSITSRRTTDGKSGWITVDLFKRGFISPAASVFRSSVWKDFYFDEALRTSEDSDAFLRLSMRTQFLFLTDVKPFIKISPDSLSAQVGVVCTRLLVLERFYYKLGGDKIIPSHIARRRLSHACRKIAEDRRRKGGRAAALELYKRAIRHWPIDCRLYLGLLRTLLLSSRKDQKPNWKIPEPLGDPIGPNRFG